MTEHTSLRRTSSRVPSFTIAAVVWTVGCQSASQTATPAESPQVHTDGASASEIDVAEPAPKHTGEPPLASASAKAEDTPSVRHDQASRHVQDAERGPLPLPEGATVLHVGDSFAGALGVPLNKRLRDAKVRSILKFRTASYIVDWAHREPLSDYLFQYKPDLVLVTLGANELQIEAPERRIPAIEKIVQIIGDRPCIWIGIPLWEGANNGLPQIIEKHAAPCRYLDTDTLFPNMPRARDNIHPTMEAREDWATKVTHWLAQERRPTGDKVWALATP